MGKPFCCACRFTRDGEFDAAVQVKWCGRHAELHKAAKAVTALDWSDNDDDAVALMQNLRAVVDVA